MTKKQELKEWIRKEFPQKADYIIKHLLSEKKIRAAGIELMQDEIFVQYPGWPNLWGSNYGRAITYSDYRGKGLHLRRQPKSPDGHVYYSFSKPIRRNKNGRITKKAQHMRISGHKLVADLFLPNYWEGLTSRQMHAHHLYGMAKDNNDWRGLVLCPVYLHMYLEPIETIELWDGASWIEHKPYQMMSATGLTLDEIVLPLKREADSYIFVDGKRYDVYQVGKYTIRYHLWDPEFRERMKKRGAKVGKSRKKKKD